MRRISNIFKFFEKEEKLTWFITLTGAGLIFWLSSLIFGKGGGLAIIPIIYHFSSFFFLSIFLLIAISKGKNERLFVIGTLIAMIYSISDEIHQYFVPGRSCNLLDIGTDFAGITLALLIYFIIFLHKKQQNCSKNYNFPK